MNVKISRSEKLDIFLALELVFQSNGKPSEVWPDDPVAAFSLPAEEDRTEFGQRIRRFEKLSPEKRKVWQSSWHEKLKNRGLPSRIDENIHPEHIAAKLKDEPLRIRKMILDNLAFEKAVAVSKILLRLTEDQSDIKSVVARQSPSEEISDLVRRRFLANFAVSENIYEPTVIDELKAEELEKFIRQLGIRETAISCRGIKTKENLAVFLKPFREETTREIAFEIRELEDIEPMRVLRAEKIVGPVFEGTGDYQEKLEDLGLNLLAMTFFARDDFARIYTAQKLSVGKSRKFTDFVERAAEIQTPDLILEYDREIIQLVETYREENKI
jgi:hypothetical protein